MSVGRPRRHLIVANDWSIYRTRAMWIIVILHDVMVWQVREETEETQKAINDLQWRTDLVSKKIQETMDATKVVLKIQKQTDDNIEDLGWVDAAYNVQLDTCGRKFAWEPGEGGGKKGCERKILCDMWPMVISSQGPILGPEQRFLWKTPILAEWPTPLPTPSPKRTFVSLVHIFFSSNDPDLGLGGKNV